MNDLNKAFCGAKCWASWLRYYDEWSVSMYCRRRVKEWGMRCWQHQGDEDGYMAADDDD